jgi:hypothetical protein
MYANCAVNTESLHMTRTLSLRIPEKLAERVAERARRWAATNDSQVYRRVIDEWVRLQEHPGIRFVDGPAGRRAALVGGPDVWEVIAVARAFKFDEQRLAAAYPWLTPEALGAARRYREAYPDEIHSWIEENERTAADLERELEALSG